MEIEKIKKQHDFVLILGNLPYIIDLKKRIEVGNLEYNLSVVLKELERSIQINPEDIITQYKRIWLASNYLTKDDDSLKRIRTVNNLIFGDLPMGKELINRTRSQTLLNKFYVDNGTYTADELIEINEIESITGSKAIEYEKKMLERMFQPNDINCNLISIPGEDKFKFLPDSLLPTINKELIDPEWILIKYLNKAFECSIDAFYAWLVYGKVYKEPLNWIYRKKTDNPPSKAQLKLFINAITGDEEKTKDAFFKTMFGITVKKADYKSSNTLDLYFKELEDEINKNKSSKK